MSGSQPLDPRELCDAIRCLSDGLCIIRLVDRRFVFTNRRFDLMFGWEPGELVGHDSAELNVFLDRTPGETSTEILNQLSFSGRWAGDVLARRRDGGEFWCHASCSVTEDTLRGTLVSAVVRDITAQKQLEAQRRFAGENRVRLLESLSPVGIFRANPDGKCTWVNSKWSELTALPRERALGDGWLKIVPRDRRAKVREAWYDAVSRRQPFRRETRLVASPERNRWLLIQRLPELSSDGELLGYVGSLTDVSTMKNSEVKLRQEHRELQDVLTGRNVLLRELHHRVKNNLQVVMSLMQLQLARFTGGDVKPLLAETNARIGAVALAHELLYSKADFSAFDLGDYLAQVAKAALRSSSAPSGVELNLTLVTIPSGFDDAVRWGLLLNELVTNCGKHAFQGRKSGHVSVVLSHSSKSVELLVSDDGVGLPKDFSIESTTTFGLALVRDLAKQMGGELRVAKMRPASFAVHAPLPKS